MFKFAPGELVESTTNGLACPFIVQEHGTAVAVCQLLPKLEFFNLFVYTFVYTQIKIIP